MCGIAGVLEPGLTRDALEGTVRSMSAALAHRGPDGAGVWVDPRSGIALGHRRLAVLELSELGAQPMESSCGRYVVVLNGEIYNSPDLRRELERLGHVFRGGSDTEVLLAAVVEWGLEGALARFTGMFAFALWDRHRRALLLARDRVGEKPLYYGRLGRGFVFGSELSAFEAHPEGAGEVDRAALALYLRFAYVPAPYSIYSRVRKLPPGSVLTVPASGVPSEPVPYWSWESVARAGVEASSRSGASEAVEELESLLLRAVRLQSVADVPVGAFLSGGIDSSTVVALMCSQRHPVRTYTIGFAEDDYNEANHARAVASHLGTVHTELQVTPREAMAVITRLPRLYSEPFADSSQIPTSLVSELARRHVTVVLSGDGADELFGGYNRYLWARTLWRGLRPLPRSFRRILAAGVTALSPAALDHAMAAIPRGAPAGVRARLNGDRLHKIAALIPAADRNDLFLRLLSSWDDPAEVVEGAAEPRDFSALQRRLAISDFAEQMMLIDALTYLPDDILVKVDRAAMGFGLEVRAPFLDHSVIEFAWRLPLALKVRSGRGKDILRRVLHRYVPATLVDRPKAGFAVPLHAWIRGPLRDWAEELLSEPRLRREGFFRTAPVRQKWREHLAGSRNWISALWAVLMFQAWQEHRSSAGATRKAQELQVVSAS